MRLIDADALRSKFVHHSVYSYALNRDVVKRVLFEEDLDNAPTVEPPNWQIEFLKRLYEKVRPQDKWGKWVISEVRCPNCLEHFDTDCYSLSGLDICPNCGALMIDEDK